MQQARLIRHIDATECVTRNALAITPPQLVLVAGSVGTIVDRLGDNDAFLVEFGSRGPNQCDWLGVLYASELQAVTDLEQAA